MTPRKIENDAVVVAVPVDGNLRLPAKSREDTVDQVDKQFLPKVLSSGQTKAPGSTKLLLTELTPLEPPTCPPDQLAPC